MAIIHPERKRLDWPWKDGKPVDAADLAAALGNAPREDDPCDEWEAQNADAA